MRWHDGWSSGGWVLMSLMMIIFWTLVIGGVIWLVRNGGPRQQPPAPSDSTAQHILDERFARGELTEGEYRQRREVLNAR